MNEITGLKSALEAAAQRRGNNMNVSADLILEMADRIDSLEQQLKMARKESFLAGADFWAKCEDEESWHLDVNKIAEEYANNLNGK